MARDFMTTALTPELACGDFQRSLTFYTEVLGFTIQYQREEDGFAMLERQGSRLMLDEIRHLSHTETDRTWFAAELEYPLGRGMNLQMVTTDIDTLYANLQQTGAPIFLALEEKWYRCNDVFLGNRQFIVQDPDGYLLRFFQDLGTRSDLVTP